VDEITNQKTEFIRLRCKLIRQKSSPKFNTVSFSLVHSRKKLWSITICCPRRKGGREEKRRFLCFVYLSKLQKGSLYNDLIEKRAVE